MYSTSFIRDFQLRYEMNPGGCWEWYGPFDRDGYGKVKRHGKTLRAHRVSYEIHKGPIPPGLVLLHSCDNPSCVNPEHLRPGTVRDNNQDMLRKGRNSFGRSPPKSSLGALDVIRIRCRAAEGEKHAALAREYGVSPNTIAKIVKRESWSHL